MEYNESSDALQSTALQRNTAGKMSGFLGDERLNEFGEDDGYDYGQHMREMGSFEQQF